MIKWSLYLQKNEEATEPSAEYHFLILQRHSPSNENIFWCVKIKTRKVSKKKQKWILVVSLINDLGRLFSSGDREGRPLHGLFPGNASISHCKKPLHSIYLWPSIRPSDQQGYCCFRADHWFTVQCTELITLVKRGCHQPDPMMNDVSLRFLPCAVSSQWSVMSPHWLMQATAELCKNTRHRLSK